MINCNSFNNQISSTASLTYFVGGVTGEQINSTLSNCNSYNNQISASASSNGAYTICGGITGYLSGNISNSLSHNNTINCTTTGSALYSLSGGVEGFIVNNLFIFKFYLFSTNFFLGYFLHCC